MLKRLKKNLKHNTILLTEGDEQSEDLKFLLHKTNSLIIFDTENLGLPKLSEITNHKHWSKTHGKTDP